MSTHRLLLPSPHQVPGYLARRPADLARRAGAVAGPGESRRNLLQDRTAAFWLCCQARLRHGPRAGWIVFPARIGDLPRLHLVHADRVGPEIQRHQALAQRISFANEALREHGAMWLGWPLCRENLDATFGPGAWAAMSLALDEARAQGMSARLATGLPPPDGKDPRARL